VSGRNSKTNVPKVPRVRLTGKALVDNQKLLSESLPKTKVAYAHAPEWRNASLLERKRAWASTSSSSGADDCDDSKNSQCNNEKPPPINSRKLGATKPPSKRHQPARDANL